MKTTEPGVADNQGKAAVENFKSNQIAEVEISYKSKVKPSERIKITGSKDIYDVAKLVFNDGLIDYKEEFMLFLLNRSHKILGFVKLSSGGITGTVCDIRILFAIALKANATYIIVAHNHPSGNLMPSEEDKKLTQKIKHGAEMLDLSLLDHIIVTSEGYLSFADEGYL